MGLRKRHQGALRSSPKRVRLPSDPPSTIPRIKRCEQALNGSAGTGRRNARRGHEHEGDRTDHRWSFTYAKARNVPNDLQDESYGETWCWVAIDAETKLVPSWLVGDRGIEDCYQFLKDLKAGSRSATGSN